MSFTKVSISFTELSNKLQQKTPTFLIYTLQENTWNANGSSDILEFILGCACMRVKLHFFKDVISCLALFITPLHPSNTTPFPDSWLP